MTTFDEMMDEIWEEARNDPDPVIIKQIEQADKYLSDIYPHTNLKQLLDAQGMSPQMLPAKYLEKLWGIKFAEPDHEG